MASVYRRATEECDISTTGHWGSGSVALTLLLRRCRAAPYTSSGCSPLYKHALVPFPFRVQVSCSPRRHVSWTPTTSGGNSLSAYHGAPFQQIRLSSVFSPFCFADDPQDSFGVSHLAYLHYLMIEDTCPAQPCLRAGLWPPFGGCPFATWQAFPVSDYYGGSVTIGFASLRPSRVYAIVTS